MNVRAALLVAMLGLAGCVTRPAPPIAAPRPLPTPVESAPSTSALGERVAAAAVAQVGQPYQWGGSAPGGFDCSGLVAYAAALAGVRVPRTASQQVTAGVPVERRQLRVGDLVFMRLTHKDLHVGVALDNVRFVHAPSRGGRVRIDALDRPPYADAYLGARRLAAPRMDAPRIAE